jgi:WhiB family redox-sensing transcriptional regulator
MQAVDSGTLVGSVSLSLTVDGVDVPAWLSSEGLGCTDTDAEMFFPEFYNLSCSTQIAAARAICTACPVRAMCLEWALARPSLEGIWAATTPMERRRIRNERKRTVA